MYSMIIADDEEMIRKGLKKFLDWEAMGVRIVAEASNGNEAEALISQLKPDIAILDIRMPYRTGIEILKEISGKGIKTKVIFLSGYEDFEYARDAVKYGAENYLTKPLAEDELIEAINGITDRLDRQSTTDAALERLSHFENSSYMYFDSFGGENAFYTALSVYIAGTEILDRETVRLMLFSIFKTVDRFIAESKLGMSFIKDAAVHVVISHSDNAGFPGEVAKKLLSYIEQNGNVDVIIGIGRTMTDMSNIKTSIEDSKKAVEYKIPGDERNIFKYLKYADPEIEIDFDCDFGQALKYIDEHYPENINLEHIAKLIHVSPSYVSSYFKKQMGMNFKDYLTKIRISEAIDILFSENIKTYELAERVGFSDARYFSELFKKTYGKTPLELKKLGKKGLTK